MKEREDNPVCDALPIFEHRSLQERAEAYDGQLNISGEFDWGEPVGCEIW